MTTHWIALHAICLLRARHPREAIAYLARFDHGGFHVALVDIQHRRIPAALRELHHILKQTRRSYGA